VNDVYFACRTCKTYLDAGYRWCYRTLEEPSVVARGKPVNVSAVLNASEYWRGSQKAQWLQNLLPQVRAFLERHRAHDLIYGTDEDVGLVPMTDDDYCFLDWMCEADDTSDLLPRNFVEIYGYDNWEQVAEHITHLEQKPWWWLEKQLRQRAKEKFESLVSRTEEAT
jgi:hypothetical protein